MARRIIIIDSSPSMRRIITTLIQSTIDDAIVSEANNVRDAMALFNQGSFHIALFSKESSTQEWLDFAKNQSAKSELNRTRFVIFSSNQNEDFISAVQAYGVMDHLLIPCSSRQMEQLVTRICSPFFMRTDRRYSHQNAKALIMQKNKNLSAQLLNFSSGGMLCELEVAQDFDWTIPFMTTVNFAGGDVVLEAANLYSIMSRLMVVENNPDFSPRRIRLACRFVIVPDETKGVLDKMFGYIEAEEGRLGIAS